MKTLLKISLLFVFALFLSMGVKAQVLTDSEPGIITCEVVKGLELIVTDPDVDFIYDEYGDTDEMTGISKVEIKANVLWTFSLSADELAFTGPTGAQELLVGVVKFTGLLPGTLSKGGVTLEGSLNLPATDINWGLDPLGNQFAGNYSVGITYALTER